MSIEFEEAPRNIAVNNAKSWNGDCDDYLKKHAGLMTNKELGLILGKTPSAINHRRRALCIYEENRIENKPGTYKLTEFSRITGIKERTLRNMLTNSQLEGVVASKTTSGWRIEWDGKTPPVRSWDGRIPQRKATEHEQIQAPRKDCLACGKPLLRGRIKGKRYYQKIFCSSSACRNEYTSSLYAEKLKETLENELSRSGAGRIPTKVENPDDLNQSLNPNDLYFSEISSIPRLNQTELRGLFTVYQKGIKAEAKLKDPFTRPSYKLMKDAREGQLAYNRLMEGNLPLVASVAKKYMGFGLPILDLIQTGNIGLDNAIKGFDLTKNTKFSTYAVYWIKQAILRYAQYNSKATRMSVGAWDLIPKIQKSEIKLTPEKGREPTEKEIAKDIGVGTAYVTNTLRAYRNPLSIYQPRHSSEDDHSTIGDSIEDPADMAEEVVGMISNDKCLEMLDKSNLTKLEKTVIKYSFGYIGGEDLGVKDIARIIGTSYQRIGQVKNIALLKLRHNKDFQRLLEE